MLKVYNVLSSLFGKTAAAAQNTLAADPRHISKENDITNVLYQNLKHEDAQLRDYIITICFVIQLAAFIAIVSVWCFKKVAALMEKMVPKMLAKFGPESENTELMENIAATTTNTIAAQQEITTARIDLPPTLADSTTGSVCEAERDICSNKMDESNHEENAENKAAATNSQRYSEISKAWLEKEVFSDNKPIILRKSPRLKKPPDKYY